MGINNLRITKIVVDLKVFPYYNNVNIQRDMANNLLTEKKIQIIANLAEGSSIRAIERITGVHRDTVMRLGVRVGQACYQIHNQKMRNIQSTDFQVDEIWGFIGKKRKHASPSDVLDGIGEVWTFIALARDTKLIPSFWVGQRTIIHARIFLKDLEERLANRVQLSSDGLPAYRKTVGEVFSDGVDFGQIVKTYSVSHIGNLKEAARRYSPAEVVSVDKTAVLGEPLFDSISTSHVEKQNHTLRMHCRRLTRLTNAFSKKRENFCAAVALNFAYYNFANGMSRSKPLQQRLLASRTMNGPLQSLWNAVASKQDYLDRLRLAIEHLHGCSAVHVQTVPVHEVFRGQTVWKGRVEVFDIKGHAKAKRCYAWSHLDGKDDQDERFVAVLEIPPVTSPLRAVQASIMAKEKTR